MSATTPKPGAIGDYVCWSPTEETGPVKLTACGPNEAAKVYVLRELAEHTHHSNQWSAWHVQVVDYETGDSGLVTVKVTVEAS